MPGAEVLGSIAFTLDGDQAVRVTRSARAAELGHAEDLQVTLVGPPTYPGQDLARAQGVLTLMGERTELERLCRALLVALDMIGELIPMADPEASVEVTYSTEHLDQADQAEADELERVER